LPATTEQQDSLPGAFGEKDGHWHLLTLRTAEAKVAIDREFAQLKAMQQEEAARLRQQVRWAKRIALGITAIVFLLAIVWALTMLKVGPNIFHGR